MYRRLALLAATLATAAPAAGGADTTALVYGDNYFVFYVNGVQVMEDPLTFTPHQAVQFTFDAGNDSERVYAIKAKDWADSTSGYEYTASKLASIGGGGLRALLSDGTYTSSVWRCFTTSYGPTDESVAAGCSAANLSLCAVQNSTEPAGWTEMGFDDSAWAAATEFSEEEAGWGRTPSWDAASGQCATMTDPVTSANKEPSYLVLPESQCLDPSTQDWGLSSFIWQPSLTRDNTVLCRIEVQVQPADSARQSSAESDSQSTSSSSSDTSASSSLSSSSGHRISHKNLMAVAVVLVVLVWLTVSLCVVFGKMGRADREEDEDDQAEGAKEETHISEMAALLGGRRRKT